MKPRVQNRERGQLDPSVHEAIFLSEDNSVKEKKSADLYRLVMGDRADLLDEIDKDLYDDETRVRRLGKDLPQAIVGISGGEPEEKRRPSDLAVSMRKSVGDALLLISRTEKQFLTEILSPVIGSATSKFFADASRHFMEQANRRSRIIFSPKTFGWLLQSLFSKQSFSEILHDNTTGFQVETVYSVDKRNFEPIAQVDVDEDIRSLSIIRGSIPEDLKDIQIYLAEQRLTHKALNTIDFPLGPNRSSVIIEGTNQMTIAVVEGMVSHDVVDRIQEVSDEIDERFADQLNDLYRHEDLLDYEVEKKTAGIGEYLKKGMIARNVDANRDFDSCPHMVYGIFAAVLIALISWQGYREFRWNRFVSDLEQRSGIMITQVDTSWGKRVVRGIKDPSAVAPDKIAETHGFDSESVQLNFTSFLSGQMEFQGDRLATIESARENRLVEIESGIDKKFARINEVFFEVAERERIQINEIEVMLSSAIESHEAADMKRSLNRYRNSLDLSADVTTEIIDSTLVISGALPEPTFSKAIEYGAFLYRVKQVDASRLRCDAEGEISELRSELAGIRIPFVSGTKVPGENANLLIDRCCKIYRELEQLAEASELSVRLQPRAIPLTGKNDEVNRGIVENRMNYLADQLKSRGISNREILPFEWDPEPEGSSGPSRGLYLKANIE